MVPAAEALPGAAIENRIGPAPVGVRGPARRRRRDDPQGHRLLQADRQAQEQGQLHHQARSLDSSKVTLKLAKAGKVVASGSAKARKGKATVTLKGKARKGRYTLRGSAGSERFEVKLTLR